MTHAERIFCALVGSGLTTEQAARRVGIPTRTAERLRTREDAAQLIEEKRTTGLGPREVLELDLYSTNSLDRRRAAVELARLERSDAADDGDRRVTLTQPMVFVVEPPACPRCGFEHEPTANVMVLAGLTPEDAAAVEALNSVHVQDVPVPDLTSPVQSPSQASGTGILAHAKMLADKSD